ncbi:MAG TPA: metalloregulator ArsR/SmtB family transcription factor [Candidatus Limnocylindria bacterium]|jgi:ArsR family transcriptional regulator|nr:metalloregulator ArsR/SmtB family transcription factor [Candidatus Limnocylindria bacterium]
MDPIYELQATVLKTLANPRRLQIVHVLAEGPADVSELAARLQISQPNVSQHLAVMRAAGVVEGDRAGRTVRYRLIDSDVVVACDTMRRVLRRRLLRLANLSTAPTAETAAAASI